jgi:predicted GNAT family acetyltransferase
MALKDNREEQRFELAFDGGMVWADYSRSGDTLVIPHVEAEPQLRGSGAAGQFMRALTDHARAEGLKLLPLCSYAAVWMRRHPETADLVATR